MQFKNFKYLIICVLLTGFFSANAQKLTIQNSRTVYDEVERPAIKIVISPESKTVKKAFKNFIEDNYDVNVKGIGFLTNKDVLSVEESVIKPVSSNKMDLYAKVENNNGNTEIHVFGSFGYDIHITPQKFPKAFQAMEQLTVQFLDEFLTGYYKERIEDTEEEVENLIEEKSDVEEELAKNKREILAIQKENKELRKELSERKSELAKTVDLLENKRANLHEIDQQIKKVKN